MADEASSSPRFDDGYDEHEVTMEVRLPDRPGVARVVEAVEHATARKLEHSLPERAARIRALAEQALETESVELLLAYLSDCGWLNTQNVPEGPHTRAYAMAILRVDLEYAVRNDSSVWPRAPRAAAEKRRVLVVRKRRRKVQRNRALSD